jgi:hypothetical protein
MSNRNEKCPVCGLKMKNCAGHNKQNFFKEHLVVGLILIICMIIAVAFLSASKKTNDPATAVLTQPFAAVPSDVPESNIQSLLEPALVPYFADRKKDSSWWLTTGFTKNNAEELIEKLTTKEKETAAIVDKYQTVSETAQKIHDSFSFSLSLYINGSSQSIMAGDGTDDGAKKLLEKMAKSLEVCFIPLDQMANIPTNQPHYSWEWQALMIPAYNLECDSFYAALVMHELGHALYHKVLNKSSSVSKAGSNLWVSEEVDMSELEIAVLNAASAGKYSDKITELVSQSSATTVQEFLIEIKSEDFIAMDAAIGCPDANFNAASLLSATHIFALGFGFIDARQDGKMSEKITFFKWVTKM